MITGPEQSPLMQALASLSSDAVLRFLAGQRWFAAKGAAPTAARVRDVIPLPWGNGAYAIAVLDVTVNGGERLYQLPVALQSQREHVAAVPKSAVIVHDDNLSLVDAVYDAEFRRGLGEALGRGARAESAAGALWVAERMANAAPFDAAESRVGSAEQSNTSIIYGSQAILKLYRTLQAGVQPDVEVTGFLSTAGHFENTPALLGTIELHRGDERLVAGMLQAYLPGSTDAWGYALECAKPYFAAPIDKDPRNDFLADAKRLGGVTRAMHEALASDDEDPGFAPEPVTGEDLDRWAHRTQQSIRESLALLEQQLANPKFPRDRTAEAQALVRRRDHYVGWVNEIVDEIGDDLGMRIRVHGDYHLGQVLRASSGAFMVIDFEGEPARPLEERREKSSPLRDVAGMLRSFAYAAASAAMAVDQRTIDMRSRELRTARWERDVRKAFLDGYLATDDDTPDVLPESEEHTRQLITLFETEKAFYELAYELNNRPDWAWIPMRGIAKLFTATT
ncbi:MAG TPA: hypothetical protein VHB25_04875 [Gemmatimonadaceae bacterium]|nr:hypothetical protein [Gemmatimonadaceae bacterium]